MAAAGLASAAASAADAADASPAAKHKDPVLVSPRLSAKRGDGVSAFALPPPPTTVLLIELRALVDAADMDALNKRAWEYGLGSFGYDKVAPADYMNILAVQSADEVMTNLCPYTTRAEWDRYLAKRAVLLSEGLEDFCRANVVPVPGINMLLDEARTAGPSVAVVALSQFDEAVARPIVKLSELSGSLTVTVCYTGVNACAIEALEILEVKPPKLPSRVHSKWEPLPPAAGDDSDGDTADSSEKKRVRKDGDDDASRKVAPPPVIVGFAATPAIVRAMADCGIPVVGVEYNNRDTEEDADPASGRQPQRPECPTPEALLDAGCCTVVPDYNGLRLEHLQYLKPKPPPTVFPVPVVNAAGKASPEEAPLVPLPAAEDGHVAPSVMEDVC